MSYNPFLVNDERSEIHFQNVSKINNLRLTDYIFQHEGINYKNIVSTFKSHPVYNVPPKIYRMAGIPRVQFIKQYGPLRPELDMEDSIRVTLHSTEVVEAGKLVEIDRLLNSNRYRLLKVGSNRY